MGTLSCGCSSRSLEVFLVMSWFLRGCRANREDLWKRLRAPVSKLATRAIFGKSSLEKTSSRSSARPKTKHGRFRTVPGSQVTRTNDSFRVVQSLSSSSSEPFIERFVCVPFMYTHSDSSCALLKDGWTVALVEATKHKASAFMVISHYLFQRVTGFKVVLGRYFKFFARIIFKI